MRVLKTLLPFAFIFGIACGKETQKQLTVCETSYACEPQPQPTQDPTPNDDVENDDFNYPPPQQLGERFNFWATNYFLRVVESPNTGDIPLLMLDGTRLGPTMSHADWCSSALEGSVRVLYPSGGARTFNYAGLGETDQVACNYKSIPRTNRVRFKETAAPFGDGINEMILIPFRTIAVAPNEIPYGSLVYIPKARGQEFTLPNGQKRVHDGYFFAGDTGGIMKSDSHTANKHHHIDVFTGTTEDSPLTIVTNTSSLRNDGYFVIDPELEALFKSRHHYDPAKQKE